MININSKIWEIAPRKFDDIIDQLLYNRGVIGDKGDEKERDRFFSPNFANELHDPFKLLNLKKAVARIKAARDKSEKIGIFGDYDADGIPASALLYKAFSRIGIESKVYIPNREDGYGLSKEGIDFLVNEGCTLIVTVDLGIRNIEEAKYCNNKVDLIITDHHLPGEQIPKAFCVINPKQPNDTYPYKELAGCGVAYKLVQGLSVAFPKELQESFLKWNLDLVCISTISDVVPLTGENRILAKYGLKVINKTQNLGLANLIKVCGLKDQAIEAYHVGFQIGPRINAPGRIDHATKSFELLISENEEEAEKLAVWLNDKNEIRQSAMEEVQKEAIRLIEEKELTKNKIIIAAGDWQKGVIGPSASKLVEKYHRPVILFAKDQDRMVGSARSVSAVNIVEIFEKIKETIEKFGGHKGAAGISVLNPKFNDFSKAIYRASDQLISESDLQPRIKIDAKIELSEITKSLYEKILRFEPFGMANSRPVFMAEDVCFDYTKFVGKEQNHLSMITKDNSHKIKSICFNFPYQKNMIQKEAKYDIAFTVNLDEWQGETKLSLNVLDLKLSS